MITEDQLEQICLEWFRNSGYEYAFGPDIAHDGETPTDRDVLVPGEPGMAEAQPERVDYRQVVLSGRLLAAMRKINRHVPMPAREIALAFGNLIGRIMLCIKAPDKNAFTLSELRDTLLPKLLSGEISINGVESTIQEAV